MGKTNKIIAELYMENIVADFDIYMVSASNTKAYKTNILDMPTEQYKALAVQYKYGKKAYVLFKKGSVDSEEFITAMQDNNPDITVEKISDDDLMDQEFCTKNFYYGNRLLVQLLLNSLASPRNDLLMYNNITGKLLYTDGSWRRVNKETGEQYIAYFLNAVLDAGMFLNLHVETYKRCGDKSKGPFFDFDEKTGQFKRVSSSYEKGTIIFNKANFDGKHSSVPFFDISNAKAFSKTKLGVFEKCMTDVEKKLGKYMKLTLDETFEASSYILPKFLKDEKRYIEYGKMINEKGVVIVDDNKSEKSNDIALALKNELETYFNINVSIGGLEKDKYNIRIIHSSDYYENAEMKDPHWDYLPGFIVQHVVEEKEHFDKKKKVSPAIVKIVQELLIKNDTLNKKVNIFDWENFSSGKTWTFVRREKIKKISDKKKSLHENIANRKVPDYYTYVSLTINPEGIMMFDKFTDEDIDYKKENRITIIRAYDKYVDELQRFENTIEGLVYSNIDNIHVIVRTPEQTMPDVHAMFEALKETDRKRVISKSDLLFGINQYLENDLPQKDENDILNLKEYITNQDDYITIETAHKGFHMKQDSYKRFNRYLREAHGIWISHEIKNEDTEEEFNYDNLLDIKYAYRTEYDGKKCFSFFVGEKRASVNKYSIHTGCPIRKVYAQSGVLEYEELLQLHSVDFVRNKQHTVLPFPFKYIREYMLNNSLDN